jgi:hypothetical protein
MKRSLCLLSIFILAAIGCSKPESKLVGSWKSPAIKGFTAEFKKDHTGTTFTPIPGHAGAASSETAKTPFKWTISNDGKITITEDKTSFVGKIKGNQLELDVNGAITILEKAK